MKNIITIIFFGLVYFNLVLINLGKAEIYKPSCPVDKEQVNPESKERVKMKLDSFYDPRVNYSLFTGRVTDRNESATIFKISSEDGQVKFFRVGDRLEFKVASKQERDFCKGHIRDVEKDHFVIYVKDMRPCWRQDKYFRRGTLLTFNSSKLQARVKDASLHRVLMLKKKDDFLTQLNDVNNFVWSFDQQKLLLASEYDKKILELKKQKQKGMILLLEKKKDQIHLRQELVRRIESLNNDLDFYKIDRKELYFDRWHLDHDLGLPVRKRPQKYIRENAKKIPLTRISS